MPQRWHLSKFLASHSRLLVTTHFLLSLPLNPDVDSAQNSTTTTTTADQSAARLRSQEYRQLFRRLPPDEDLIEDFNCAFQENILIQGHMYLFVHHICFYSNIFGYETKYFFAFFLSRDEAYRIINDGWSDGSKTTREQQESVHERTSQENGALIEKVVSSSFLVNELDSTDRNKDTSNSKSSEPPSTLEDGSVLTSIPESTQGVIEEGAEPVLNNEPSSSTDTFIWKEEETDAPNKSKPSSTDHSFHHCHDFIMQLSILALLVRPKHIHLNSPMDHTSSLAGVGRSSEVITWLEKRVHNLKDEMQLVGARLESMRREHSLLKGQIEDFKHLIKRK